MFKFLALLALVSAGREGKTRSMSGITALHANTRVTYWSLLVMVWFLLVLNLLYMLVLVLMLPFKWWFSSLALWLPLLLLLLLWWIDGLFTCLVTLVIATFPLLATWEWFLPWSWFTLALLPLLLEMCLAVALPLSKFLSLCHISAVVRFSPSVMLFDMNVWSERPNRKISLSRMCGFL